jgi:hypothetical protein
MPADSKKKEKKVRFVERKASFESNLSNASNPHDLEFQGTKNAGEAIRHATGTNDKAKKKKQQGKTS